MRFLARRLALIAIASTLVLAPAIAGAQAPPPPGGPASPPPPPPGGPAADAPAPEPDSRSAAQRNLDGPADAKTEKRDAAGFTFSDKPSPRRTFRVTRSGPLATFPGFEQLPDGGSRLFVHLSQTVPVEERRAQGSITYVLRGAHVRVHNDTNALVTVHFNTPVATARLVPSGNDTLFVVSLRAGVSPTFKMLDNQDRTSTLMVDFAKGDFGGGDLAAQTPDTPQRNVARKVGRSRRGQPPPAPNTAPPPPGAAPAAPPPAPPPAGPTP